MGDVNKIDLSSDKSDNPIEDSKIKTLSYLLFLNEVAGKEQAASWGISYFEVPVVEIRTADECIECLGCFLDHGVWPAYLFNRGDIWFIYISSIAEERFIAPLRLVMTAGGPGDLMLYLRACYRFGYPAIPDQEYDILERLYLSTYPALDFLNKHTNDDDEYTSIVKDAIRMSGVRSSKEAGGKLVDVSGQYASLNFEKSTSILPVRSYQEAYDYLLNSPRVDTHWSLKVDGFNTKCLFKSDGTGLELALSRGRASDSWDYTEAVQRVIEVQNINVSGLSGKVTGEAIVDVTALELLRQKYPDKEYKSPKSTAGAMLRAPQFFDKADYQYLHFYPFDNENVRKDIAFDKFTASGFCPPPAFIFKAEEIPLDTLDSFSAWLDLNVLDPLWEAGQQQNIGSDGVVLQLLTDIENDRADKYSDLNIALKFSHWTEAEYTSVVTGIVFEQRRVEMSVVLEIEPVTTRDLNVATRVSVGSPAILVKDNVRVGDTIIFARKSEAINIYLGKR